MLNECITSRCTKGWSPGRGAKGAPDPPYECDELLSLSRRMERKQLKQHFTLPSWIDDSWYVGKLKEVPGVFSQGRL